MNKIEDKIKTMFQNNNDNLRENNIEREKEYFKEKTNIEFSFDEYFNLLREQIRYADDEKLDSFYNTLIQGFLFSKGHDYIYKRRLISDAYITPLMESLFYPILKDEVMEKLNNSSTEPNSKEVLETIYSTIFNLNKLQSILLRLYVGEFSNGLDIDIDDSNLIKLMNKYNITVDKFLHALIDEKCNIMVNIFEGIQDDSKRTKYLEKVEEFRKQKHEEIDSFPMSPLQIQTFFHYTTTEITDMIYGDGKDINIYLINDTEDIPKRKS